MGTVHIFQEQAGETPALPWYYNFYGAHPTSKTELIKPGQSATLVRRKPCALRFNNREAQELGGGGAFVSSVLFVARKDLQYVVPRRHG